MHSKWQIWDFFSIPNREMLKTFEGILSVNTFDPLSLKFVKEFLLKGAGDPVVHYKVGSEITRDWIMEEFQTLSLFGNADHFFIHEAHQIQSDLLEEFLKLEISGRFVILSFENENASWKKIIKNPKMVSLQIESPRFWEINKLLDFVCQYLKLPLQYEAKSWMLSSLENDLATFYNSCCLVKLNYPEAKEITLADIKSLLSVERLDQFALASTFARKKFRDFYEKVLLIEGDFEKSRSCFGFMQSHLVKMADTSYLASKARLTQYDKDLQGTAKLWNMTELMSEVQKMSHFEVLSKKKDPFLWHHLRVEYFRAMSV